MENKQLYSINREYSSDTLSLSQIRKDIRAVFARAGLETELADQLVIAVNEACMNIVQHADNGHYKGTIRLDLELKDTLISVQIVDDAETIEAKKLIPVESSSLKPGGLGLHFINEIMDRVEHSAVTAEYGNKLTLTKDIKGLR